MQRLTPIVTSELASMQLVASSTVAAVVSRQPWARLLIEPANGSVRPPHSTRSTDMSRPNPPLTRDLASLLLLVGGTAAIAGATQPWMRMLIVSVVGSSTAWGIAAAAAGGVAIVAGALRWRGRQASVVLVLAALAGATAVAAPLVAADRKETIVAERIDAHLEPHGLTAVDILGSPTEPSLFDQFAPFLSGDAAELVATVERSMHTDTQRGLWITVVGGAAVIIGALAGLRRRPIAPPQHHLSAPADGGDMTSTTFTVTGMTCGSCVRRVTEAASTVAGVTAVDVQLKTGLVSVAADGPLDVDAVKAAIDSTGYRVADVTDGGLVPDTPSGYVDPTNTPQGYMTSTGGIR